MNEVITSVATEADEGYDLLERLVAKRLATTPGPWFTTDATGLWDAYLGGIPEGRRQHYNCRFCRAFIERYGGLATIDEAGVKHALLWDDYVKSPMLFRQQVFVMEVTVRNAKVTGVFLAAEGMLGVERNVAKKDGHVWTHLHGPNPTPYRETSVKNAGQAMAEKVEDYGVLCRGLAEFNRVTVGQALRVLEADALGRSEKAVGIAKWLLELQMALDDVRDNRRKSNLIWRAVSTAPPGYCHVRNTVLATLLDDVKAGLPFEVVSRKWAQKTHPLQYQRPQAAPTGGQLDAAEALVKKLGLERSLLRRYATLDDVLSKVWTPSPATEQRAPGEVFGHLRAAPVASLALPERRITVVQFLDLLTEHTRTQPVLTLELLAPVHGPYYGLLTATDPTAPPILQWDGLMEQRESPEVDPTGDGGRTFTLPLPRNPVSWYFQVNGSRASRWGLLGERWVPVTAAFLAPHQWQRPDLFAHQHQMLCFALQGAQDSGEAQLGLFPEILKAELRGIRAVVEAHNASAHPTGREGGNANGLAICKGSPVVDVRLRVTTCEGPALYRIDRWE